MKGKVVVCGPSERTAIRMHTMGGGRGAREVGEEMTAHAGRRRPFPPSGQSKAAWLPGRVTHSHCMRDMVIAPTTRMQ